MVVWVTSGPLSTLFPSKLFINIMLARFTTHSISLYILTTHLIRVCILSDLSDQVELLAYKIIKALGGLLCSSGEKLTSSYIARAQLVQFFERVNFFFFQIAQQPIQFDFAILILFILYIYFATNYVFLAAGSSYIGPHYRVSVYLCVCLCVRFVFETTFQSED